MTCISSARSAFGAAVLGCLFAAPGCVDIAATNARYVDRDEKRFAIQGTPEVTLATFDGSIDVRSWDRQEVLVVIERRAVDQAAASDIVVDAQQNGDRISVEVRSTRRHSFGLDFGGFYRRASLSVTLPKAARVQARSGDGRIGVRDVSGELTVQTGDGSIRLDDVSGDVEARSGDGSILIGGMLTRLRATSGDGSVTVRAAEGSTARDDWNINTGDGSVVLELADGFGGELDAHTGDGRVVLRNIEMSRVEDSSSRHTLRGRLGAGGSRVRVKTGDGSITLRRY